MVWTCVIHLDWKLGILSIRWYILKDNLSWFPVTKRHRNPIILQLIIISRGYLPSSAILIYDGVVFFTLITFLRNLWWICSIRSILLKPHTSHEYVNIGTIVWSNSFNVKSIGNYILLILVYKKWSSLSAWSIRCFLTLLKLLVLEKTKSI